MSISSVTDRLKSLASQVDYEHGDADGTTTPHELAYAQFGDLVLQDEATVLGAAFGTYAEMERKLDQFADAFNKGRLASNIAKPLERLLIAERDVLVVSAPRILPYDASRPDTLSIPNRWSSEPKSVTVGGTTYPLTRTEIAVGADGPVYAYMAEVAALTEGHRIANLTLKDGTIVRLTLDVRYTY